MACLEQLRWGRIGGGSHAGRRLPFPLPYYTYEIFSILKQKVNIRLCSLRYAQTQHSRSTAFQAVMNIPEIILIQRKDIQGHPRFCCYVFITVKGGDS